MGPASTSPVLPNDSGGQHRRGAGGHDQAQSVSDLIRDLFVDVLGVLIPGMVFTLAVLSLATASGMCFLGAFGGARVQDRVILAIISSPIGSLHVGLLAILGYVIGGTFFRQDPKLTDQKSLARILRDWSQTDLDRSELPRIEDVEKEEQRRSPSLRWRLKLSGLGILDLNPLRTKGTLGWRDAARIANSQGAQFPYSHIADYLSERGFSHLAKIVPWNGEEFLGNRSKMFINALKIRLELVAPADCGELVRNEAHIRMMSSLWYASATLYRVSLLSALPVLASVWRHIYPRPPLQAIQSLSQPVSSLSPNDQAFIHHFLIYSYLFSFILIAAFSLKRHVESCFHYQRVREVVYVLETAFSVDQMVNVRRSGNPEILENLPPKPGTSETKV